MRKITFLFGAAVGYVAGAAAGRERYEQIKTQAQALWGDPRVQDTVAKAQTSAVDAAKSASSTAKEVASAPSPVEAAKAKAGEAKASATQKADRATSTAKARAGRGSDDLQDPPAAI